MDEHTVILLGLNNKSHAFEEGRDQVTCPLMDPEGVPWTPACDPLLMWAESTEDCEEFC